VPHYWRPRRGQQVTNRSSPRHVPGCYVKISLIKDIFSREGLATAGQGHFTHATHSPARWGICPHARSFLGFVQFSVPAFQHPLFSRKSQDPKFRHFAHMPEVPTATSDLTGGTPRRPRTQATTVSKRARLYRRLRVFSVRHLIKDIDP